MTRSPGTRDGLIDLSDLLAARPARSELIYLLGSLDKQDTAENPEGSWQLYYARRISGHLADGAATRNQAGRRAVINGSRCRPPVWPPGQLNVLPHGLHIYASLSCTENARFYAADGVGRHSRRAALRRKTTSTIAPSPMASARCTAALTGTR